MSAPLVNGFHTVFPILTACYVDVVTTKDGTCGMVRLNTVIWRQRRVINQGVPVVVTHGVPYLMATSHDHCSKRCGHCHWSQ